MSWAGFNLATGPSGSPGRAFGELLPWLVLLVGLVIAGAIIVWLARRVVGGAAEGTDGFSLHQLRQLHASGELSDD